MKLVWMKRNSVHFLAVITLPFPQFFFPSKKKNKKRMGSNGDKKMHGVPFHH